MADHEQEQIHQEIFNYCKSLNTIIMGKSIMLAQESENLNNTTKRVTAPKEYIFTELKYSQKAQRKILNTYLNEAH